MDAATTEKQRLRPQLSARGMVVTMTAVGTAIEFGIMAAFELFQSNLNEIAEACVDAGSLSLTLGLSYFVIQHLFGANADKRAKVTTSISLALIMAMVEIAVHPILDVVGIQLGPNGIVIVDTLVIMCVTAATVAWFETIIAHLRQISTETQATSTPVWKMALLATGAVIIFASLINAVPSIDTVLERNFDKEMKDLVSLADRERITVQNIARQSAQVIQRETNMREGVADVIRATGELADTGSDIDRKLTSIGQHFPQFFAEFSTPGKDKLTSMRKTIASQTDQLIATLSTDKPEVIREINRKIQSSTFQFLIVQNAQLADWRDTIARKQAERDNLSILWMFFSPIALVVIGITILGPVSITLWAQERALTARSRRYDQMMAALGHAHSAILLLDGDGNVAWVNPAVWTLLGHSSTSTVGRKFTDLLEACRASEDLLAEIGSSQADRLALKTNAQLTTLTGRTRHIDIELQAANGVHGLGDGFVAILTDVTEINQMRSFLRGVFDGVAQGIVIQDSGGTIIDVNPAAEELLGLTMNQLKGLDSFDPRWRAVDIDGHDLPGERHPAMVAMATGKAVKGAVMGIDVPGHERRWLLVDASLAFDPITEQQIVIASFSDISLNRKREQEIREARDEAEHNLRELQSYKTALDQHAIVSVADRQGLIIHANLGFQKISGYTEAELLGKSHNIVNSGHHEPAFFADMWKTITSGKPWRAEICNKAKDGSPYWVDSTIIPVTANDGSITSFVSVRYDITARVNAQNELLAKTELAARKSEELELTLTHMNQGISAHDSQGRLSIWNEHYLDMFSMTEADIHPGTTLAELLDLQKQRGNFEGDPADLLAMIRKSVETGQPLENITPQSNGRLIKTIHSPMPGGGHVSTHEDVTDREQAAARIRHAAHHDTLTGLPNRIDIQQQVAKALTNPNLGKEKFSVLLVDLDRFKAVNDTFGHGVGDKLLQKVAERMLSNVRQSDTVARLGGDEFAIYFSADHDQEAATASVADRLRHELCMPFDIDGKIVSIGASIGAAIAPDHGTTVDELFRNADLALYHIKANGRQAARIFDVELERTARERREIETDLREAIARDEFEVHYQPFHSFAEKRIVGVESLIRWHHPKRGFVSPDVFIPIAEDTNLIEDVGDWVIRRAIRDAASLPESVKVAVNVSARQVGRGRLVETISKALVQSKVAAERLEVEVTETVLLRDDPSLLEELARLKAMNISIALDDFGTGYSSLKHLKMFPFDKIKIDRSFVSDMLDNPQSAAIVGSLASLARSLDMKVTAEGVESADIMLLLAAAGCTYAQGYHLARPMPLADLAAMLETVAGKAALAGKPHRKHLAKA